MIVFAVLAYAFVAVVLLVGIWGVGEFLLGMAEGMRGVRCRHCGSPTWVDEAGWDRHVESGERRCAGADTTATPMAPPHSLAPVGRAALSDAAYLLYNASLALADAAATADVECANDQLFRYAMEVHNQATVIADYDQWACAEIGPDGPVCAPAT